MATSSNRPGMGAIPYPGGTTFRVWCPNVPGVTVHGDFGPPQPLAHDGNGYWSSDVPGAQPGHRYIFKVELPHDSNHWRIDPYARQVTHSAGDGVIAPRDFEWPPDAWSTPPWNELVIYQLHPGTFNDFSPFDGRPAQFDGIVEGLGHIRDLGANAIQLLPTNEFPTDYSWGYNPTHNFAVESAYGGPAQLARLVAAAHAQGIAVLMDVVYNHFGPQDLGRSLWRFNGESWNGRGGIYFYNDARSHTPWGEMNRPDYGRGELRQFLRDNALYWLEEFRIDGLRFDATAYIRLAGEHGPEIADGWSLMQWINDEIRARQPWKITIAEDLRNNEWITRGTGAGGAGFGAQWDAGFVHPVRDVLAQPFDEHRDLGRIVRALTGGYNGDPFQRVLYTESHDEVALRNGKRRLPTDIDPANPSSIFARKRSTLGAALMFTAPGIPMFFQGQEFLEDTAWHDDRPLDWRKAKQFAPIALLYRDLIRLRRNWFDSTRGLRGPHVNVFHFDNRRKVLAYHRRRHGGPGDDVLVVMNFSNQALFGERIGAPRGGLWRVRLNSDARVYSADFPETPAYDAWTDPIPWDGLAQSIVINVGPYAAVILSQDPD